MTDLTTQLQTTFDHTWRELYTQGYSQLYPWDAVVSFVFRYAPKTHSRDQVRILEVGCGTASNLWFAAREGFSVTGVDASDVAIDKARDRFIEDGLDGEFIVADFTQVTLESNAFDLAIDRAAITTCGFNVGAKAIRVVRRSLKPGGFFFFNPYAAGHSSQATGKKGPDGVTVDISGGTLVGVGQICFYDEEHIRSCFASGWRVVSMRHMTSLEKVENSNEIHSEWRVIAQKT